MNNKIRGIKDDGGISTCTYGEAIIKCTKTYNNPAIRILTKGVMASTIAAVFERDIETVQQHLAQGHP